MITKNCEFDTKRLSVKDWQAKNGNHQDSRHLVKIVQSILTPGVTRHLPLHWQGHFSEERTQKWIVERDQEGVILLVVETSTDIPIGFLTLFETTDSHSQKCEIKLGYVLSESAWGRGFATELVNGFIQWSKNSLISKIVSVVVSENPGSIRVLEKCGFTRLEQESNEYSGLLFFELCFGKTV